MGHISQQWEDLQGPTRLDPGKLQQPFLYAAKIVQVLLTYTMYLWDKQNKHAHGY